MNEYSKAKQCCYCCRTRQAIFFNRLYVAEKFYFFFFPLKIFPVEWFALITWLMTISADPAIMKGSNELITESAMEKLKARYNIEQTKIINPK